MFQGLFQEDAETLTNLICATLHWPRSKVKSIEITLFSGQPEFELEELLAAHSDTNKG